MATLTAVFELVDRISDKLDAIADSGGVATRAWEDMGRAADSAFDTAETAASGVVSAMGDFSQAAETAAERTDFWTNSVGNYDKSALEAMYSTQELVEMGYKSADALEYEAEIMSLCDKEAHNLSEAINAAVKIQEDCSAAMEQAAKISEEVANNDKVSAETKEELKTATESATKAYEELETAQSAAKAALDEYNAVVSSGTANIEEIEAAASKMAETDDNLVAANEKAANATDELSKSAEKASQEAQEGGENSVAAIENISAALAAAGIAKKVKEIAESAYELVTAFSEAESTVVLATGATGDALNGLTESMMNAYSVSKTGSLDETAAAVGEINTRLAYTDEKLTETTGLFLDFAAVTGGNAAKSVRSVTQLMNQWHVPAEDMETVLSKLTYAGQASGISVDTLSSQLINNKAVLDQLGFTLDEATAMFMNFELAGTNTSAVMMGFRSALATGAISSLEELYAVFDKISTGAMTAAEASDLFGTRAGPAIVNAVKDGTLSLDSFVDALENAGGTLAKTAETAQTLDQKWEQATNNIEAAFTETAGPAVDAFSEMLANSVNGIGNFLHENELLTKILSAVGIGLGVVVTGIAGITFVTKVAIPLITSLVGSLSAAQMVGLGFAGVAAGLVAFAAMSGSSADAFEEETRALEALNAELDNLEARHNEITSSYKDTNAEIDAQYTNSQKLIDRLRELDAVAEKTAGTEIEMKAVVDKLNEAYPQLGVTLGDVSDNLDDVIAKFEKAANADSRTAKFENAKAKYAELVTETDALKKAYDETSAEARRANAEYAKYGLGDAWTEMWGGKSDRTKWFEDANAANDRAYKLYMENLEAINECKTVMEEYGAIVEGTSEEQIGAYDAVTIALNNVKDASEELISEYNESYQAAYDSVNGTIGLFDQMAVSCETSTDQMIAALKSQSDYLATYTENLKTAANIGLNEGLIAALSDGSEESAGYLDAIIAKVEELGGTTDEAKAFIDEMNGSFEEVETAKDEFATTVADMQTDFDKKMSELSDTLEQTISHMKMDTEAAEAARETFDAYVEMIESYKGKAGDAAAQVADAVNSALAIALLKDDAGAETPKVTYGPQFPVKPVIIPAHANGTTNAEDVFLAGEEGPELIVGKSGASVFPSDDTERIVQAVSNKNFFIPPAEYSRQANSGDSAYFTNKSEKKITLEITGGGSLNVSGSVSKEAVLDFVMKNIEPKLLEILETETMEEGEGVYEY